MSIMFIKVHSNVVMLIRTKKQLSAFISQLIARLHLVFHVCV